MQVVPPGPEPALIEVIGTLLRAATPAALRRFVHQLVDEVIPDPHPPEPTTPPAHEAADGVVRGIISTHSKAAAPHQPAGRGVRPASLRKPTPPPATSANGRLPDIQWLELRDAVRTEQRRRGWDWSELANALRLSMPTVKKRPDPPRFRVRERHRQDAGIFGGGAAGGGCERSVAAGD